MKKFAFLIILLFCLSNGLKAQLWGNLLPSRYMYGPKNLALEKVQGSPYLSPEFVTGKVYTSDGKTYSDIPLRYNCYNDILEFKKEGIGYDITPKDQVSKAEFGGKVFGYLEFEPHYGLKKSYFQMLTEGRAILCIRYQINFLEREELRGFSVSKPDRFDDLKKSYWISLDKAPAKEILNRNNLLEILSDKKNEVEGYLSGQKLSIKKVDDLKKIVIYYNTL